MNKPGPHSSLADRRVVAERLELAKHLARKVKPFVDKTQVEISHTLVDQHKARTGLQSIARHHVQEAH